MIPLMMPVNVKRELLQALYDTYSELIDCRGFACERTCYACCTHNVLATTIEVDVLMEYVEDRDRADLAARILGRTQGNWMRPRLTINGLAEHCLRREEPPEPILGYDMDSCPLCDTAGCSVYPVRPFACRALWSRHRCAPHGEAVPDEVVVTLNGVFEQLIEDMDTGGLSGNMIDLFARLSDQEVRSSYRAGQPLTRTDHLISTRPNPGLIVPVEHRSAAMNALTMLDRRRIQGLPFRQAVKTLSGRL